MMRNYPPEDELRIDEEREAFINSRCGKQFVCEKPNEVNYCNQLPNDKCDNLEPYNQLLATPSSQLSNEATPTNHLPDEITPSSQLSNEVTPTNHLPDEIIPSNQLFNETARGNQLFNETAHNNHLSNETAHGNQLSNETTHSNHLSNETTHSNHLSNETTPSNQFPNEVKSKTDDTTSPKPWAEHFKPRPATEVVKNCSQVDRSVQLDIVTIVTKALLEGLPRWIELSQDKTEVKQWNRGGTQNIYINFVISYKAISCS